MELPLSAETPDRPEPPRSPYSDSPYETLPSLPQQPPPTYYEPPAAHPTLVPAPHAERSEVLYVPLAVTVGDGFKFGCGFFLAAATAFFCAILLMAALFAVTSFMGLNLPVGR
jgi:hypothetical protein